MALQAGGSRGLQLCGCVASNELGAVGAGKTRWLDNPAILVAMTQEHLAIATEQVMVMRLSWKQQFFHSDPVLKRRVRSEPVGSLGNDSSEDLCLIYPKSIARIDATDLKVLAHRKLREREGAREEGLLEWRIGGDLQDGDTPLNRLPFLMWNVNRTAGALVCADGALTGIMPLRCWSSRENDITVL